MAKMRVIDSEVLHALINYTQRLNDSPMFWGNTTASDLRILVVHLTVNSQVSVPEFNAFLSRKRTNCIDTMADRGINKLRHMILQAAQTKRTKS